MTILTSPYPDLDLHQKNILSHVFPPHLSLSDDPIWHQERVQGTILTLRKAFEYVRRFGLGLQRLGLQTNDVILMCSPNHIYVPVAYLGTVGSTFIFSGANPSYKVAEIAHQVKDTDAKIILVHPSKLYDVLAATDKLSFPRSRIFQFSDAAMPPLEGILDWMSILASAEDAGGWHWPELMPEQARRTIATINYSSGTTGLPKGVRISHACLIANMEQLDFIYKVGREQQRQFCETSVAFLPLYHAYGQLYTILLALRRLTKVYVMSSFDLKLYLELIQRVRPTTLQLVPPILVLLAKRPEVKNYDLSSVKSALSAAAPLSRQLQNEINTRFGINIQQGWGMTELTCGGICMAGNDVDKEGSVGYLMPNTQAKLLDENGRSVMDGEAGELFIRGPQVCLGYWHNEKASQELLSDDGWLRTGDMAVHDAKTHRFWIIDRKKELIKVNGLQVAPAELEAVLLKNELIADAAVVRVTVQGTESPRAYVVLQPAAKGKVTTSDIQDWLAQQVAPHKYLRGGVAFVEAIPKFPSGKIVRKVIREWATRDSTILEKRPLPAKM